MSLETSITDLTAASNALTDTVNNKIATIDAEVQVVKADYINAVASTSSAINLLSDSGRFDGGVGLRGIASGLYANSFFSAANGSTFQDGGKFIHDNSTNGGLSGALNADVSSLLLALGRTTIGSLRFGVEFYINKITAGSGVVGSKLGADSVLRYLLTATSGLNITASFRKTSVSMMVKVVSGSVNASQSVYPNADVIVNPADGWVRVVSNVINSEGYINGFPFLYSEPGSVILIALPFMYAGDALLFNSAPVSTI